MRSLTAALAALAVTLIARTAAAQDAPAPVTDPADYRWAVYTSCSVVFALLGVYLVMSHLRAAKVSEEVAAVERRLDELEKSA